MSFDSTAIRDLAPGAAFSLEGKVAAVTGASGGIGRWLAAGLGAAGARVFVTDISADLLADVTKVLDEAGIESAALACDLTDEDAPIGSSKGSFASSAGWTCWSTAPQ